MNEMNNIKTAILNKELTLDPCFECRGCEQFDLMYNEDGDTYHFEFETKEEHEDGDKRYNYIQLQSVSCKETKKDYNLTQDELDELFCLADLESSEWF